jgi:hypothetical protein
VDPNVSGAYADTVVRFAPSGRHGIGEQGAGGLTPEPRARPLPTFPDGFPAWPAPASSRQSRFDESRARPKAKKT